MENLRRILFILLLTSLCTTGMAEGKKGFLGKAYGLFENIFMRVDTNWIEPQHYNFQTMLQNTNTYERYRISDDTGNSVVFAPKPAIKVGPYIGWGMFFVGYTFDVAHIKNPSNRKEFDLSFYTLPIGIDLYWRQSGDDYRIKNVRLRNFNDASKLNGKDFSGFSSSIKGINAYYIFNHRRFSYPAAFSQSTLQKRSAGSAMAGLSFTHHSLDVDWKSLNNLAKEVLGVDVSTELEASKLKEHVVYTDFSLSGGYGYNWVFARNWMLAASLSLAVSYKSSYSDSERKSSSEEFQETISFKGFEFKNLSLDGIGRFGVVWNNLKYFGGINGVIHSYNYNKDKFYTNNWFGSVNIYFGMNFGLKSKYKTSIK